MDKEQAKSILRNVVNPDVKEAIETLIPELNENEDERNWKAVLDCVKDDTLKEWLKKKKEQKHLLKFDVDAAFDAREPRDNWEYIKEFCDKFGRMPKDMDELDELVSYVMVKKQKEQKPSTPEDIAAAYQMGLAKGRNEQKPAECSEEDEGMLNCIIATLCEESHGGRETNDKMVTWLENRLKSLRPQPHWKPSEEQMNSLQEVIILLANLRRNLDNRKSLESLYDDLKKL